MTDKQLAILLTQYSNRLRAETENLKNCLPDELKGTSVTSILGIKFEHYPCLVGLETFLSEIESQIRILEDKIDV